jgi:tetratricopeptide (TPR) repeat protein
VPDESETPLDDAAEPLEAERDAEVPAAAPPKKLPAGWQPGRAGAKAPQPVFVDEPDPNQSPSPFADKRYGPFRKQMALMAGVALAAGGLFLILFWFRPPPQQAAMSEKPAAPAPPSLSPEELRQLELARLRSGLQDALAKRDWPAIETRARAILRSEPADGEAWHALGWFFEKHSAYEEAAQAYGKAVEADFLRPQALLKRAAMLRVQKRYAEALPDLEESARLDPDSVVTPNLLMICKIQAGKTEEVRTEVTGFDRVGIVANADRYLLGKAALALHDGDFSAAAQALAEFRSRVAPPLFAVLIQDPYFEPFRGQPAVQRFLLL